jgi:predicted transcriptional regulator
MKILYSDKDPEGVRRFDFNRFAERLFKGKRHQNIFKIIWKELKQNPDEAWTINGLCSKHGLNYDTTYTVVGKLIDVGILIRELGFLRLTNRFSETMIFYAKKYRDFYKQAPQKEKEYLD